MAAAVNDESENSLLYNNNKLGTKNNDTVNSLSNRKVAASENICETFGGYNADELYSLATTFLKGVLSVMMWNIER